MPQITVTVDDQTYWELRQVAKGRLSAFVNQACSDAIGLCLWEPLAYIAYARDGIGAARAKLTALEAMRHSDQTSLTGLGMKIDNEKLKDGTFFKEGEEE